MFAEIVNVFVTRIVGALMHWIETKIARVTRTPEPPPLSASELRAQWPHSHARTPTLVRNRTKDAGIER
jgi:hypothetical protein